MWNLNEYQMIIKQIDQTAGNIVMLVSATEKVGKTYLLTHIAKVLIESYQKKVIFFDINKRNPFDHRDLLISMEMENNPNFTLEIFEGKNSEDAKVRIEELKEEYDYVLIDSSPINTFNQNNIHPLMLSSKVNQSYLVVNKEFTKMDDLNLAISFAEEQVLDIKGYFLNNLPVDSLVNIEKLKKILCVNIKDKVKYQIEKFNSKVQKWMKI